MLNKTLNIPDNYIFDTWFRLYWFWMTQHTKCTQQGVILNKTRSSLKFVKIVERITVDPRNNGKFGHPEFFSYCGVFRYFAVRYCGVLLYLTAFHNFNHFSFFHFCIKWFFAMFTLSNKKKHIYISTKGYV